MVVVVVGVVVPDDEEVEFEVDDVVLFVEFDEVDVES